MEKRLKYLLGFIFGILLLISSSYGYNQYVYVDGVTTPIVAGGQYANYLYTFQNFNYNLNGDPICEEGSSSCPISSISNFGYSVFYNGQIQLNRLPYSCSSSSCDNSKFGYYYNNSSFGLSLYTGWYYDGSSFLYSINKTSDYGPISVYIGINGNNGKNFVSVGDVYGLSSTYSPVYGIGKSFFSSSDYIKVDNSDYFRFFFEQNVNLSSPLDGFDLVTLSGSNMTGSYGREYFYQRGTRTNFGYISDDGLSDYKYKHFGLFGYGYSYSYLEGSSSLIDMSWNDLKFVTVNDSIYDYQRLYGDVSYSEFLNLSYRGILTIRPNSYISRGNDNGVYLLSKNPNNLKQIIYEHWSCNTSDLRVIFSGGNSTVGSCVKLDGGYLTYNGSTSIMPFNDTGTKINASSDSMWNSSFPFVQSVIGDESSFGYTKFSNNTLCISSDYTCYGLSPDNTVNLYEIFLNDNPGQSGGGGNDVFSSCVNNPDFYGLNRILCDQILNTIGQPVEIPGMTGCYISYGINSSGSVVGWVTCQDDFYNTGVEWVDDGSGGYWVCADPEGCDNFGWNSGVNFDLYSNSGASDLINWFSDYFEHGFFFKCPFNYNYDHYKDLTIFGTKVFFTSVGRDFLYPIYCMGAGFRAGKNNDVFGSFSNVLSSRLLNSDNYKGLYNLFDIILTFGILFFVFKVYNLIK